MARSTTRDSGRAPLRHAALDRLTKKQEAILHHLRKHDDGAGHVSLPLAELAQQFGVSSATMHGHLKTLQRKGFIAFGRPPGMAFFIRLLGNAEARLCSVPVVAGFHRNGLVGFYTTPALYVPVAVPSNVSDDVYALLCLDNVAQHQMRRGDIVLVDPKRPPRGDDVVFVRFRDLQRPFYLGLYVGAQIEKPPAPPEAVDTEPIDQEKLADYTAAGRGAGDRPLYMILAPFNFDDPAPVVTDTKEDGFHKITWIVGGSELYATMVLLIRGMGF